MPLVSPDVEPLWVARFDYQPGTRLPAHAHRDYFQFMVIASADGGEAVIEGVRYPLTTGQILFFPPNRMHGLQPGTSQPVRTLDIKFKIVNPALRRACCRVASVHAQPDRRIAPLVEMIHAEAQRADEHSADLCRTLLTQVLLLILRGSTEPKADIALPSDFDDRGSDVPSRVHRYLRDRCDEAISQRSLSETFCFSYHHLHALYRDRFGESPLRALRRFRIERAMQLIRYSDYGMQEIAKHCGFSTVHHFTRVFASVTGASPARWRNQDRDARDVVIHPGFVNRILVRPK